MSETKFSDGPDESDIVYRPFNALALLGFLAALVTVFCCVLFVASVREQKAFSFIAICVGSLITFGFAVTTWRIDPGGKRLSGSGLLKFSMFIVVLFVSFALMHYQFQLYYLKRSAVQHARTFMQNVYNGNYGKAYSYTVDPRMRIPEGVDPEDYYSQRTPLNKGDIPPIVELNILMNLQPFPTMMDDKFQGKNEYIGVGEVDRDLYSDIIGVDYMYTPKSSTLVPVHYRVIMMRRAFSEPLNVQWQAKTVKMIEGPPQARGLQVIGNSPLPKPDDNDDEDESSEDGGSENDSQE